MCRFLPLVLSCSRVNGSSLSHTAFSRHPERGAGDGGKGDHCVSNPVSGFGHIYLGNAEKLYFMANLHSNVGLPERLLSVVGGAILLYDTITKRKVSMLQTMGGTYLLLRGVTGFCLAYDRLGKKEVDHHTQNINIRTSMTVNRPRDQVYAFWRRLQNLPLFMNHLKTVKIVDDLHSEWTATLAGDLGTVSWKSEIVKDDPGSTLSWHSLPGSTIENAGKVTFSDAGLTGTQLDVVISYHAPLGILGEKAARLLNPVFEKMVEEDVHNFKRYMETQEAAPSRNIGSEL